MKKTYIVPTVKEIEVRPMQIIAGSPLPNKFSFIYSNEFQDNGFAD